MYNDEEVVVYGVRAEYLQSAIEVYNFEVEDWHTYFVSKNSVLVHNDCTEIKNVYSPIKKAPNYPSNFKGIQNGTKKVNVNNGEALDSLRKIASGEWKNVYQNGYVDEKEVSIHYFQHTRTGTVFDVKTKNQWSTGW